MAKKISKTKTAPKNNLILVMVVSVAICAILVLAWMVGREIYAADSRSAKAFENSENIVINNVGASQDLVDYLLAEKSGCESVGGGKNTSYIVKEANDIALTMYGCALDAKMFYKKTDGEWRGISPTNQFIEGVPVCSHLKDNVIPADFQPYCYGERVTGSSSLPELRSNPIE